MKIKDRAATLARLEKYRDLERQASIDCLHLEQRLERAEKTRDLMRKKVKMLARRLGVGRTSLGLDKG